MPRDSQYACYLPYHFFFLIMSQNRWVEVDDSS